MRALLKEIEAIPALTRFGRVARIEGLAVEVTGALGAVRLGEKVYLSIRQNKTISCEVVGFRDGRALVMPLGPLEGIALGARRFRRPAAVIHPTAAWLGRVIDGFGNPMDGKGPLPRGMQTYPLKAAPPPQLRHRRRSRHPIRFAVRLRRHLLPEPLDPRSNSVTQAQTTQDDRLQEAQTRMSANSGVNLDEELTNLTTYQQAYAASARMLTVVNQLYDTLPQIPAG